MRRSVTPFITLLFAAVVSLTSAKAMATDSFSPYVDAQGNIEFPKDFRTSMVHLGSWFVPEGGASGFHDVYTEKESVEVYRKTGKFPDGATLVKELRAATAGDYTTGQGVQFANSDLKQWFVMIKDSTNRFAGNPLWGDGWGWALYKPDNPEKNVATSYKSECLGCHVPAKDNDWVYTEAYPTLKRD
jgi:hypothetical protein